MSVEPTWQPSAAEAELADWAQGWAMRRLRLGAVRHDSEVLYFTASRGTDDPGGVDVASTDRADVVRAAAKRYKTSERVIALTGGGRNGKHRAIFIDVYDRIDERTVSLVIHWKVTLTGKCVLRGWKGREVLLGPASPLPS